MRYCKLGRSFPFLGALLTILVPLSLFGAEITVPRIEMASQGWVQEEEFLVSSLVSADIALLGGDRYGFLLGFALAAPDLGGAMTLRQGNEAYLGLRLARASIYGLGGLPLDFSYFIGAGDNIGTGGEFPHYFGSTPFETEYRGPSFFPRGVGGNVSRHYQGIHGVRGTGFQGALRNGEYLVPILYLYHDFAFSPELGTLRDYDDEGRENYLSADLRVLFSRGWLNLEAFTGYSRNGPRDIHKFRWGLMAHLAGEGVEFYAQAGVPGILQGDSLTIDHFYVLIEPRLFLGPLSLFMTFFYHPVEYHHVKNPSEQGRAELNIRALFGNRASGLSGGLECSGELGVHRPEELNFRIGPVLTYHTDGIRWDAKLRIRPQAHKVPAEMFEILIGVRTAF
ncbi:MAG: hypothetical protein FWH12_05725 [Treponema sp.]|nr:hypothetical protein [Treponema sp.]